MQGQRDSLEPKGIQGCLAGRGGRKRWCTDLRKVTENSAPKPRRLEDEIPPAEATERPRAPTSFCASTSLQRLLQLRLPLTEGSFTSVRGLLGELSSSLTFHLLRALGAPSSCLSRSSMRRRWCERSASSSASLQGLVGAAGPSEQPQGRGHPPTSGLFQKPCLHATEGRRGSHLEQLRRVFFEHFFFARVQAHQCVRLQRFLFSSSRISTRRSSSSRRQVSQLPSFSNRAACSRTICSSARFRSPRS